MLRPPSPRASWSLLATTLALVAAVALGADGTSATAAAARPDATSPRQAGVEGLSVTTTTGHSTLGDLVLADPDVAFGPRSGLLPPAPVVAVPASDRKAAVPETTSKATSKDTADQAPKQLWWKRYQGTNHVWMPTLGISKHVYYFSCTRSRDPDNLVYRWGCAGANNVYLLGHAHGVFEALHDAYYNGKLRKGMPVVYANGAGKERLYRVKTWRVLDPYDGVAWAIASQPVPSMTLQTCIGRNDSLRLVVRLVQADE